LSNGGGKSCFFIVKVREDSSFFRLSRQNLRKEAGKRQKRACKKEARPRASPPAAGRFCDKIPFRRMAILAERF